MVNNTDPNKGKRKFDRAAFKKAIGMVESSGGKYLSNKASSAAGRYHFLYDNIRNHPDMKGVSKIEFMKDNDLQEKIMDQALNGKLSGYPNYIDYSKELKTQFGSSLAQEELAALTHYLGKGGVKKYLRNQEDFNVPGKNASVTEYLDRFNNSYIPSEPKPDPLFDANLHKPTEGIQRDMQRAQDATSVNMPAPKMLSSQPSLRELAYGGNTSDMSSARDLLTFDEGGTHEQNPYGGLPIGNGSTIEEGETKVKLATGDYVFSNRFGLMKGMAGGGSLNGQYAEGGDVDPIEPPVKKKENKLMPYITKFKDGDICTTNNCSEYTTTEYANIVGKDRKDIEKEVSSDAWYKRSNLINKGGKSVWDGSTDIDYNSLRIGDFVSLGDGSNGRNYQQPGKDAKSKSGDSQENYARHSGIIIGMNKEGTPIIRHNYSGRIYDEPIDAISKASKYVPLSITRAKSSEKLIHERNERLLRANSQHEISENYNDEIPFDLSEGPAGKLFNTYKKNRKDLAINYNIPPDELDFIFQDLVGIGQQESNLGNENADGIGDWGKQAIKDNLPGPVNYLSKVAKNALGFIGDKFSDYEVNDKMSSWERQMKIDTLIGSGLSEEDATRKVFEKHGVNSANKPVTSKSKGVFKQKGPSERWLREYGGEDIKFIKSMKRANWDKEWDDNEDNLMANAVGLYLDNRDKMRETYKGEDDEFIRKATILAHNAPTKASNKKYTDFYLKGKGNPDIEKFNSHYVNSVDKHKKNIIKQ